MASSSSSRGWTSLTMAAIRRGEDITVMPPCRSRVAASFAARDARTVSAAPVTSAGGSSSTPISKARSAGTLGPGAAPGPSVPADLAFEIGVEELPPAEVTGAAETVRASLAAKLAATRLRHGGITVMSSPRRIAAIVSDVQPREDDAEQAIRGPRLSAAYDADGNPTKAARGFAAGHGIDVTDLRPM